MTEPIHLAFVWHQHQPYYKLAGSSLYFLPWTRLHAVKDYYDIPALMSEYPTIHHTFNLTPSLLVQLDDYVNRAAADRALLLTLKQPSRLTEDEKRFVIDHFFMANRKYMIDAHDRYRELSNKPKDIQQWTDEEIGDLQVWFNIAWLGFMSWDEPAVKALCLQGRNFSQDDKRLIVDIHYEIMSRVTGIYSDLSRQGQFELSVSPMYHPILPLLCDISTGGQTDVTWRFPQDARRQINDGVAVFERMFHHRPGGMWPSEGAVSHEALTLMAEAGFQWTATDEAIYEHSDKSKGFVTQPHVYETTAGPISIIFRDRQLSDAIGFRYAHMSVSDAVQNFVDRVEQIRQNIVDRASSPSGHLVSVILDGENCWENYEDNGRPFLRHLLETLSNHDTIITRTVSEFLSLQDAEQAPRITRLHAGSWINHSFDTWFGGHEEKKKAWRYLSCARQLIDQTPEPSKQIWQELFVAEGSDWFWWYGDDHSALHKHEFDFLFRLHLKRIYELAGQPAPADLDEPIMASGGPPPTILRPEGDINPTIDGRVSPKSEWTGAGCYVPSAEQSAMHMANPWIERIFYGRHGDRVCVRIDFATAQRERFVREEALSLRILTPKPISLTVSMNGIQSAGDDSVECAHEDILEMSFIRPVGGDPISLAIQILGPQGEVARFPTAFPIVMV